MFGPESGKFGWQGLPFLYDRVKIVNDKRLLVFVIYFLNILDVLIQNLKKIKKYSKDVISFCRYGKMRDVK
jgi:hypothetical protein